MLSAGRYECVQFCFDHRCKKVHEISQRMRKSRSEKACTFSLCGNFEKRLSEISGEIIDFEIPLQIPHPRFSIIFRREISHFRSHHPTEKERFGKNRTSLHFRKNSVFTRVSYLPKYLFSRPSNALPCLASSRAISWTVSWIASRLYCFASFASSNLPAVAPFSASTRI